MSRVLRGLVQAIFAELHQINQSYFHIQDPSEKDADQLRTMYGRGEINREQFFRFRRRLNQGQMIQGELAVIHREARYRLEAQGKPVVRQHNREIARSLERLYMDLGFLEEARYDTQNLFNELEAQIKWIRAQADDALHEASASLPDDTQARAYLSIWQSLQDRSKILKDRTQKIKKNLNSIQALTAEIRAYEAELMVLEMQVQQENLKVRVRQDLLS
jgi:predicted metalloendopeptidase